MVKNKIKWVSISLKKEEAYKKLKILKHHFMCDSFDRVIDLLIEKSKIDIKKLLKKAEVNKK